MDDASGVRFGQGIGNLHGALERLPDRQSLASDQLGEGRARHVLHGNEVHALLLVDVVDVDDVGMIEGRGGLGLLDEPALAFGVGDLLGRQDFQGNKAVEVRVAGLVDHSHPALAQLLEDLVVGDTLAEHTTGPLSNHRLRGVLSAGSILPHCPVL